VTGEDVDGFGLPEVPQLDGVVPRAAEQSVIGGVKMETAHLLGVPLQGVDALLGPPIPHLGPEPPVGKMKASHWAFTRAHTRTRTQT
jgi:hypothetical protein